MDFKYTTNANRRIFVANTYPMGITLLESLKNIAWDSYLFEGMTDLAFEDDVLEYHHTHVRASYGGEYTPCLLYTSERCRRAI